MSDVISSWLSQSQNSLQFQVQRVLYLPLADVSITVIQNMKVKKLICTAAATFLSWCSEGKPHRHWDRRGQHICMFIMEDVNRNQILSSHKVEEMMMNIYSWMHTNVLFVATFPRSKAARCSWTMKWAWLCGWEGECEALLESALSGHRLEKHYKNAVHLPIHCHFIFFNMRDEL